MPQTQTGAVAHALDIANMIRRVVGEEQVDDLIPGFRSEPRSCVLANTFDAGCYVGYSLHTWREDSVTFEDARVGVPRDLKSLDGFDHGGYVLFEDEKVARAVAGETRTPLFRVAEDASNSDAELGDYTHGVVLPNDVAGIAQDFDNGQYSDYVVGADEEE